MAIVNPGYRGIAYLDAIGGGTNVRFASADVSAKQEVVADDLIMGDWDRDAYYYGKIEVGGSISGPVTETFTGGIAACGATSSGDEGVFQWAATRTAPCGSLTESGLTLYYYCDSDTGEGRSKAFTGMKVNSLNFSCTAGDVAQFSIDVMGKSASTWNESAIPHFTTSEKLITWDKVSVGIGTPGCSSETRGDAGHMPTAAEVLLLNYQSFSFDISNNLEAAYSLSQANLFPVDIVPGLRSISGSLTAYNAPNFNGFDTWDDYWADGIVPLTFNVGNLSIVMNVRFHRVQPASATGLITSTVAFTGVGHQDGAPWEA